MAQHCGSGVCCRVWERRKSRLFGGVPSSSLLTVEVVGGLFLGVFLYVSGRSDCGERISGGFQEEGQPPGLPLEVVVVRELEYMFEVLG